MSITCEQFALVRLTKSYGKSAARAGGDQHYSDFDRARGAAAEVWPEAAQSAFVPVVSNVPAVILQLNRPVIPRCYSSDCLMGNLTEQVMGNVNAGRKALLCSLS